MVIVMAFMDIVMILLIGIGMKKTDFKISCYSGTAGEKYAKFNRFDYELK